VKPRDLARAAGALALRFPDAELVRNSVGNLTVLLDDEYIGWVNLRTGEVTIFADEDADE
jgi:hypothetical protein